MVWRGEWGAGGRGAGEQGSRGAGEAGGAGSKTRWRVSKTRRRV
ncbi:hypothetical protein [Nostoc sp. DedSLP04]|nr:hypothetical protein [Nostoc sp. DedSLP04]MDZ8032719.1 hypothetical protein [Nostoc sp. DedSLP04]